MNDLSWHAALGWSLFGAAIAVFLCTALQSHGKRKKRNRRLGLPAPVCERMPSWHVHAPMVTQRQAK